MTVFSSNSVNVPGANNVTPDYSWALALTTPYSVTNASYTITTIGYSKGSGLIEDTPATRDFVIDNTIPSATIILPVSASTNTIVAITGTAVDVGNPDQPSMTSLTLRIKRDDAQYWDCLLYTSPSPRD